MLVVRGQLRLGDPGAAVRGAAAHVRLEEVSRADAPARRVAELVLRGVELAPGEALPFELPAVSPEGLRRCTVRVLLDLDGDGRAGRGDWVSRQAYPVLGEAGAGALDVVVWEIR